MSCSFGSTSKGETARLYEIKNSSGVRARITDYGANLVSLFVPDQKGNPVDVVLGYEEVSGYEKGTCFIGAVIGRVANRIGGASIELNERIYPLTDNDHGNTLHSGRDFTNQRMWEVENETENSLTLKLHSPDGDQGYPGSVDIYVTYSVTEENGLSIHYTGIPTEDTLLNLTNHSYFNLSGHKSKDVLSQKVMLDADAYTRADAASIPTGEILSVEGTPMDFRTEKPIGQDIEADYEALKLGRGYDHNWVLNGSGMRKAASMYSGETGICMEVWTDLPGVQFYTANYVEDEEGKDGAVYGRRSGACFETQYFPDAIHKDHFKKPIVHAGEEYCTTTVYKFYKG